MKRIIAFSLLAIVVIAALAWLFNRRAKIRWAQEEALPQVIDLIVQGDHLAAFTLAEKVGKYIPENQLIKELWPRMSTNFSITTTPLGADVYFKEYSEINGEWNFLGKSPLL